MCRQVTCPTCSRPTWAGCGAHVEAVLGHIPKEQRCRCQEAKSAESAGAEGSQKGGLWGKLFGG
jgi:hypothetical protein